MNKAPKQQDRSQRYYDGDWWNENPKIVHHLKLSLLQPRVLMMLFLQGSRLQPIKQVTEAVLSAKLTPTAAQNERVAAATRRSRYIVVPLPKQIFQSMAATIPRSPCRRLPNAVTIARPFFSDRMLGENGSSLTAMACLHAGSHERNLHPQHRRRELPRQYFPREFPRAASYVLSLPQVSIIKVSIPIITDCYADFFLDGAQYNGSFIIFIAVPDT